MLKASSRTDAGKGEKCKLTFKSNQEAFWWPIFSKKISCETSSSVKINCSSSAFTYKDAAIEEEHHRFEKTFATHVGCCFPSLTVKTIKGQSSFLDLPPTIRTGNASSPLFNTEGGLGLAGQLCIFNPLYEHAAVVFGYTLTTVTGRKGRGPNLP